jgi:phosphonate transport system substrate-binding protein
MYAGSHDAALLSLVNGNVDACAVQDITYNEKTKTKEVDPAKFKIVWSSDPLPQSPLAVRKDLDPALRKQIVDCFLALEKHGVKMHEPGNGDFVKFVPCSMDTYQPIATMAKTLGLTNDQMVK